MSRANESTKVDENQTTYNNIHNNFHDNELFSQMINFDPSGYDENKVESSNMHLNEEPRNIFQRDDINENIDNTGQFNDFHDNNYPIREESKKDGNASKSIIKSQTQKTFNNEKEPETKLSKEQIDEYLSKINFKTNSAGKRKINKKFKYDYERQIDYTEKLEEFIPKEQKDYFAISVIIII